MKDLEDMRIHLDNLIKYCEEYKITDFVSKVLNDNRFNYWSGSGKPEHHHYGDGGLLKHTSEVTMFCFDIAVRHQAMNGVKLNIRELLVSAIWHDYGKIWDYQKDENGVWGKHDNHARQVHHISRSVIEWQKYATRMPWMDDGGIFMKMNIDNVTHNILSHHGMREWGSPVAPATREAWILHLADNLSARLDDCDKHDIIKH